MDSIPNLVLVMSTAGIMGLLIGQVYKLAHSRAVYSSQMVQSLIVFSILTAMMLYLRITVSTAVLLGAVSIIRFRNPIKDHRDLAFILWTIVAGFCCATHMYGVLGAGSVLTILVLILFKSTKQYGRVQLAVKSSTGNDEAIIKQLDDHQLSKNLKMIENNSVGDSSAELIYEVRGEEEPFKVAQSIKEMIYGNISDVTEVIVMYQEDDMAV